MIIESLKSQYHYDKKRFVTSSLIVSLVFFSTGLVIPYVLFVQSSVSSLANISLYNSIFAFIGTIITILLISKRINSDHITRLIVSGVTLSVARLFVGLIPYTKSEIVVFISTIGAMSAPIFFAELLYFTIKFFNNTNKMKTTIMYNVMSQTALITGYFTSSLLYPNYNLIFFGSSLILMTSLFIIILIYRRFNMRYDEVKINVKQILLRFDLLSILLISGITITLINFISPFVFEQAFTAKFTGFSFIIAALIMIFVVPNIIKCCSRIGNIYIESLILFIISLIMMLIMINTFGIYIAIIQYTLIALINAILITSRHNLFKVFSSSENWVVSLLSGLILQISNIFLFVLKVTNATTIKDVVLIEIIFVLAGILFLTYKILKRKK